MKFKHQSTFLEDRLCGLRTMYVYCERMNLKIYIFLIKSIQNMIN